MQSDEKIQELIEKIRSGEIYGEIQIQLEKSLTKRKNPSSGDKIDKIQKKIRKKEEEIAKILGEIIRLKNDLSKTLEKELREGSKSTLKH